MRMPFATSADNLSKELQDPGLRIQSTGWRHSKGEFKGLTVDKSTFMLLLFQSSEKLNGMGKSAGRISTSSPLGEIHGAVTQVCFA